MHRTTLAQSIRFALLPGLAAGIALAASAQTQSTANEQRGDSAKQTQQQKPSTVPYRGLRASQMIGMSVRNTKGDNIGQISDMIVNMNTGEVRYAILRFDPGILSGEELYAVPTKQLRIAPDRNDVVFDMNEDRLERASIDRSTWDEQVVAAPGFTDKFDQVWGVHQPWRGARAHRMSDLIGKEVNSRSGDEIGEIEDLVVNMATSKVHYAVLEFDTGWADREMNYAVPLRMFDPTSDRDELVLDADKATVQAMKSFPDNRWANLNDPVWVADIDRYLVLVVPGATTTKTAGATPAGGGNTAAAETTSSGQTASDSTAAADNTDASRLSASELFMRLDEDKSGSLDKAEVKDSADIDRDWTELDGNDDGRVSRDEFSSNYTIEPKQ